MAREVLLSAILLVVLNVAWAHYSSTWAVHVPGGKEAADEVAAAHGFVNLGEVRNKRIDVVVRFTGVLLYKQDENRCCRFAESRTKGLSLVLLHVFDNKMGSGVCHCIDVFFNNDVT
ncbi:unnamed protein product [Colias eurytheme]|nr:unnamed protein product [Colias eurytheme]